MCKQCSGEKLLYYSIDESTNKWISTCTDYCQDCDTGNSFTSLDIFVLMKIYQILHFAMKKLEWLPYMDKCRVKYNRKIDAIRRKMDKK